jgi:hypothetical protein
MVEEENSRQGLALCRRGHVPRNRQVGQEFRHFRGTYFQRVPLVVELCYAAG